MVAAIRFHSKEQHPHREETLLVKANPPVFSLKHDFKSTAYQHCMSIFAYDRVDVANSQPDRMQGMILQLHMLTATAVHVLLNIFSRLQPKKNVHCHLQICFTGFLFLYRHGSTFFRGPYKLNLVILSYLTLTWRCAIKNKTQSDTFYNSCHVIFHLYFGYLHNPSKLFLSLSFQCLTLITRIQQLEIVKDEPLWPRIYQAQQCKNG